MDVTNKGFVEWPVFWQFLQKSGSHWPLDEQHSRVLFHTLDLDSDGFLSEHELVHMRPAANNAPAEVGDRPPVSRALHHSPWPMRERDPQPEPTLVGSALARLPGEVARGEAR